MAGKTASYMAIIRTPHRTTGHQQVFFKGPFDSQSAAVICARAYIQEGNGFGGCGDYFIATGIGSDHVHELGVCRDGEICGWIRVKHGMKWAWTGKDTTADELAAQVGPGWSGIVRRLVADLLELGWGGEVFQVKEKFGGLRFYIGDSTPAMNSKIFDAEDESFRTCEKCGEPGIVRGNRSWILTLCEGCNGK